jgi:uncharacterized RDD family membrane protein YckC
MEETISPVPREARPYQGRHAGLVSRLIANAVDGLTVVAVLAAGYAGLNGLLFMLDPRNFEFRGTSVLGSLTAAAVVLVLYQVTAWSTTGRTYGHHLMGLRVVGTHEERLWVPRALLRSVLCVLLPIGLLWCAVSPTRRSLQDIVVRTWVIYDWQPHPRHT